MRLKPRQYWAIIITLLFHTIVFWFLFFVEVQKNKKEEYKVELNPQKDKELEEKKKQLIEEKATKELQELLSNKAAKRAVANESFSENYTDNTKELQEDFDKQKEVFKQLKQKPKKRPKSIVNKGKEEVENIDSIKRTQTVFYVGNSRVEYFLAKRYRVHLTIPVYKCEGAGIVEVAIIVNAQGQVINAEVMEQRSHLASDCMKEAALQAALTSSFSKKLGYIPQKGRIVYQFAKQ